MMLSLTAFSQTGTDTIQSKTFPVSVVKLMIKDLLSGDSAKLELKLTEKQLYETEKKVNLKDSVIYLMKIKEVNYTNIIGVQNQKYGILETYTKKVEINLKKEKVKGKFKSILSVGIISVLTFLLITK